jgi:hypothetical protein
VPLSRALIVTCLPALFCRWTGPCCCNEEVLLVVTGCSSFKSRFFFWSSKNGRKKYQTNHEYCVLRSVSVSQYVCPNCVSYVCPNSRSTTFCHPCSAYTSSLYNVSETLKLSRSCKFPARAPLGPDPRSCKFQSLLGNVFFPLESRWGGGRLGNDEPDFLRERKLGKRKQKFFNASVS